MGEACKSREHRLGPAREDVSRVLGKGLGHEHRLDDDLRARKERRCLRMCPAPESEDCLRAAERLREVWHGRDPDATRDEQGALDGEVEPAPERAEHMDRLTWAERAECLGAGADRIDEERELSLGRQAEAHRLRKEAPRSLQHEELAWGPGLQ